MYFGDKHVETENQSNKLISQVSHGLKKIINIQKINTHILRTICSFRY